MSYRNYNLILGNKTIVVRKVIRNGQPESPEKKEYKTEIRLKPEISANKDKIKLKPSIKPKVKKYVFLTM
jgi:hypothetical protein